MWQKGHSDRIELCNESWRFFGRCHCFHLTLSDDCNFERTFKVAREIRASGFLISGPFVNVSRSLRLEHEA